MYGRIIPINAVLNVCSTIFKTGPLFQVCGLGLWYYDGFTEGVCTLNILLLLVPR